MIVFRGVEYYDEQELRLNFISSHEFNILNHFGYEVRSYKLPTIKFNTDGFPIKLKRKLIILASLGCLSIH